MNKVKKQHYVWEFYLKAWATDNQIWCKRAGSIFNTSTENVAQERYFYAIEALSTAEIKLLTRIVKLGPKNNQIADLSSLQTYSLIANSQGDTPRFGMESYHTMIESNAIPVVTELRNGNGSILDDRESRVQLCIYLGHQYTRTKKIKNSVSLKLEGNNIPEEYKDCDMMKIHNALIFIFANSIGGTICDHLDLRLIKNESDKKLITSDQPIYNFLSGSGGFSNETLIYFPISPGLALWAEKYPNENCIANDQKVEELNSFIVNNSNEFIFAASEDELKQFL
ncbi:MAG: DUF4238 domain-containing protein [Pseudomonadota bacterium]